jgi:hypothetical protein
LTESWRQGCNIKFSCKFLRAYVSLDYWIMYTIVLAEKQTKTFSCTLWTFLFGGGGERGHRPVVYPKSWRLIFKYYWGINLHPRKIWSTRLKEFRALMWLNFYSVDFSAVKSQANLDCKLDDQTLIFNFSSTIFGVLLIYRVMPANYFAKIWKWGCRRGAKGQLLTSRNRI